LLSLSLAVEWSRRTVVVTDDYDVRFVPRDAFEGSGHFLVVGGQFAINVARDMQPDVVLLDLDMSTAAASGAVDEAVGDGAAAALLERSARRVR
jgi:CheY-like chemotaxis protein